MTASSEKGRKRSYLDHLIAAKQTPLHMQHILVAMRDYGISFFPIVQNCPRFDTEQLKYTRGFLALIGDDTSICSMGPDHFDRDERVNLKQLVGKCSHAAIISSAIVNELYDFMAVLAGEQQIGALIIETRPEHELLWAERIHNLSPNLPITVSTSEPDKIVQYGSLYAQGGAASHSIHS